MVVERAAERVTFAIDGLGCGGGGALTVERALTRLRGVARAYVNPATEMAYVEYDPVAVGVTDLARRIEEVGFRPGPPRRR